MSQKTSKIRGSVELSYTVQYSYNCHTRLAHFGKWRACVFAFTYLTYGNWCKCMCQETLTRGQLYHKSSLTSLLINGECRHKGQEESLWTPPTLNRLFLRATTLCNCLLSEPLTTYEAKHTAVSIVAHCTLIKQDNINGHVQLNMDIIFISVLMLCSKLNKFLYIPLEIQIIKVVAFFETQCRCITKQVLQSVQYISNIVTVYNLPLTAA